MGYQQWILKFKFLLSNSKNGFNILFFIRIWRITKCLLPSVYSIPFCLLVLLFAASCFYEFLAYHCGMISGRFSKALVDGLYDSYIKELTIAIILVLCQSFCTSVVCYLGNILYVAWRSVLTNRLHRDYFSSDRYYKINILHQRSIIDNPDQRITQDVDKLCLALSEVFVKLILTPITIAYYSYKSHKSVGSKPLLYIYLFFIGFAILNKFLMSPVSRWVAKQEKKEGNFRFQHVSVRTNAESIAFQQAGQAEMIKSNRKLHELIRTLQSIFNFQLFLKASMEFSAYFAALLSYISIAGPIFSGKYANFSAGAISGIIENNAFVVIYLIGKLTIFVNIAIDVTKLTGTTHRVGQLMEEMDNLGYDDEGSIQTRSSSETGVPMKVKDPPAESSISLCKLENLTLYPPGERTTNTRPLIENLNIEFLQGIDVLITGESGCGKSSLLRCIRGLWSSYSGSIHRSHHLMASVHNVFFLPQIPLMTEGTFMDQLSYPLTNFEKCEENTSTRDDIIRWISMADLTEVLNHCGNLDDDVCWNWQDVLSPGEMQRLSFLRLFYHKPMFAVLDEATSSVDSKMEEILYTECQRLEITLISVGHRNSLKAFHQTELKICQNGNWQVITQ